jgi:hypothetical protein
VLADGAVLIGASVQPWVGTYPVATVENLYCALCHPHFDFLLYTLEGNGIILLVYTDMAVEPKQWPSSTMPAHRALPVVEADNHHQSNCLIKYFSNKLSDTNVAVIYWITATKNMTFSTSLFIT